METKVCNAKYFFISGDNIVNVDFVKKTTVTVNRNGSTFAMAPITHSDAGRYISYTIYLALSASQK